MPKNEESFIDEIVIKSNKDFETKTNELLDLLLNQRKSILDEKDIYLDEFNKVPSLRKRYDDGIYIPEELRRWSPTALLDAKWGTGKTYFIEKLIEQYYISRDEKDKSKKVLKRSDEIDGIILIDAWSLMKSDDISLDLSLEIFQHLVAIGIIKDEATKKKIFKFMKGFGRGAVKTVLKQTKMDLIGEEVMNEFKLDSLSAKEANIQEISKYMDGKNILIIIDNLDRCEDDAWNIIKIVLQWTELKGFTFLFLVNMFQFRNNSIKRQTGLVGTIISDVKFQNATKTNVDFNFKDVKGNNDNDESPFKKFIDMNVIEFKQKYYDFLVKKGFKEEVAKDIDDAFLHITKEENSVISIRDIESIFLTRNLDVKNNGYLSSMKLFNQTIFSSEYIIDIVRKKFQNLFDKYMAVVNSIDSFIGDFKVELKLIRNSEKVLDNNFLKVGDIEVMWNAIDGFIEETKVRRENIESFDTDNKDLKNKVNTKKATQWERMSYTRSVSNSSISWNGNTIYPYQFADLWSEILKEIKISISELEKVNFSIFDDTFFRLKEGKVYIENTEVLFDKFFDDWKK